MGNEKKDSFVFKIDGAIVMTDIKEDTRSGKKGYLIPTEMNRDYAWALIFNNTLWASVDARKWSAAIAVDVGGEKMLAAEVLNGYNNGGRH